MEFSLVGATNEIAVVRDNIASALNSSEFGFEYDGTNLAADNILWEDGAVVFEPEVQTTTAPIEVC